MPNEFQLQGSKVIDGITVLEYAPEGFTCWGIGSHTTIAGAIRKAKSRGPSAIIVHRSCRLYGESWIVGRVTPATTTR